MKITCVLLFSLISLITYAQFELDVESGVSWNTKNQIRFPNGDNSLADLLDVTDDLGTGQTFFYRLRGSYIINDKHVISALYAPLQFETMGQFNEPVRFGNEIFDTQDQTTVTYKFNSYRLTYRYVFLDKEKIKIGAGLTGKIRDARVAFSADGKADETTDVGFVPLINFSIEFLPNDPLSFIIIGDALVGPQGRAEDVFVGAHYTINENIEFKAGYRVLEGGADVDQVYNFSLIHYGSIGIILSI